MCISNKLSGADAAGLEIILWVMGSRLVMMWKGEVSYLESGCGKALVIFLTETTFQFVGLFEKCKERWPPRRTSTTDVCQFCFQFYFQVNYKQPVGLLLVGVEGPANELLTWALCPCFAHPTLNWMVSGEDGHKWDSRTEFHPDRPAWDFLRKLLFPCFQKFPSCCENNVTTQNGPKNPKSHHFGMAVIFS